LKACPYCGSAGVVKRARGFLTGYAKDQTSLGYSGSSGNLVA